jgi:UDP-4-amino-4,6-dideoxy-N-acetyl-beta-L-altrosamine N-acetyltransferase
MTLGLTFAHYSARPVTMEDAGMMLEWRNSAAVREGMFHSRLIANDDQIPWLRSRIESNNSFYYILQYRGRPVGVFGVYDVDREQGTGEWVYFMGPKSPDIPRGIGAAGEFIAMETFLGELGLRRVWGRTMRSNERVWQLHQRFGFQIEGTLREHIVKDGEIIDVLIVGLLAREWQALRNRQYDQIFLPSDIWEERLTAD